MIQGDSTEYELLKKWAEETPIFNPNQAEFFSVEIGVRKGLGSKIIMDTFMERLKGKNYMHIGIDPYGHRKYQHYDDAPKIQRDYTYTMMEEMMEDFKEWRVIPDGMTLENFHHCWMTDQSFMNGGSQYSNRHFNFVHFDGPHMSKDVMLESVWFANRAYKGTRFVFNDYPKYKMNMIEHALTLFGFEPIDKGENKYCLEKK